MLSLVLFTILVVLTCAMLRKVHQYFTYWQRQGLPGHHFISFAWASKPYHEWALGETQRFGKIWGCYDPTCKMLVLNDPKLAREISIKEFHKFPQRFAFNTGTSNIRKSIFFMDANEDWKRVRSIVTPAFTSGKLRAMMSPIERIAGNFIDHLRPKAKSGEEFDMKKHIGGFAMDVIACCGYGIELDSISTPNHPVVVNAKKILNVDANLSMIVSYMFPAVGRLLRLEPFDKKAVQFFDDLTFQIVQQRLASGSEKQNPDFMGLMIEESQNGSADNKHADYNGNSTHKLKGISQDEVSGQGILFFIAGFDTTHATFDHAIYYLSKYPEWQERLFQELDQHRDELDYGKLRELPILNAIINETLRLCPPLVEFHRIANEDTELGSSGIQVEKGTIIMTQPVVIHRDPDYFPDPLAFKPDRFLDKSQGSLESNFAYMPFGLGQRLCVGMRFAQNELRIGLANFVLNFKVNTRDDLKLEYFRGSVLMSPKSLMVRISER